MLLFVVAFLVLFSAGVSILTRKVADSNFNSIILLFIRFVRRIWHGLVRHSHVFYSGSDGFIVQTVDNELIIVIMQIQPAIF